MPRRSTFPILVLVVLLFLALGDRLPSPVGEWSLQTRQSLNQFVISLFPSWDPKLNPNQRTESELRQIENSASPKP